MEAVPAEYRQEVARLVTAVGEERTREILGVTRHPLARVLAGLPVRQGTFALIKLNLASGPKRRTAVGAQ